MGRTSHTPFNGNPGQATSSIDGWNTDSLGRVGATYLIDRNGDIYRTIAPGLLAASASLIVLVAARPWIEVSGHLIVRLAIASLITLATATAVLAAMPAGRLAIQSLKEMLFVLLRGKREFQTMAK